MAKAKQSSATPTPMLPKALDSQLTKALGLVGSKHYAEAMEIFKALVGPAKEAGNIALQRTLRNYLAVCEHKTAKAPKGAASPEGDVQWLLNKKDSTGALALLEKSIRPRPQRILQFLKATAHAQLGDAEAAAEVLNRSLLLNSDLIHLYRLETDFDAVRTWLLSRPSNVHRFRWPCIRICPFSGDPRGRDELAACWGPESRSRTAISPGNSRASSRFGQWWILGTP